MHSVQKITPCLWFNGNAEAAARFYTEIFPNSKVGQILRYGEEGREIHGQAPGSVLTVAFELDGQTFTGLNGGPLFQFMIRLLTDPDPVKAGRVMKGMMGMKKIDMDEIKRAYAG